MFPAAQVRGGWPICLRRQASSVLLRRPPLSSNTRPTRRNSSSSPIRIQIQPSPISREHQKKNTPPFLFKFSCFGGPTDSSGEEKMEGGTEAFPDLGRHCQNPDCNLLDFLPFTCDGCRKVFCLEHRSYKSHECPRSDHRSRRVVVCEACSTAIEATGEDEKTVLERHEGSGDCDPRRKKKPACPVRRCREVLTFSNASTCKGCGLKVCLKHRFPADHGCGAGRAAAPAAGGRWNEKFVAALASRGAKECGKKERGSSSPPSTPTIKAY